MSQRPLLVLESSLLIRCSIERVWEHVTNVDVSIYQSPVIFKLVGIPQPLRAELSSHGVGAKRTAWFDNKKRFTQVVMEWDKPTCFRFSFLADPGFVVGYFFDLSDGPFQILEGWYQLTPGDAEVTTLSLGTKYQCAIPRQLAIPTVIDYCLGAYQRFLLRMIRANCEAPPT